MSYTNNNISNTNQSNVFFIQNNTTNIFIQNPTNRDTKKKKDYPFPHIRMELGAKFDPISGLTFKQQCQQCKRDQLQEVVQKLERTMRNRPDLFTSSYKTKACQSIGTTGTCDFGNSCLFIHSIAMLWARKGISPEDVGRRYNYFINTNTPFNEQKESRKSSSPRKNNNTPQNIDPRLTSAFVQTTHHQVQQYFLTARHVQHPLPHYVPQYIPAPQQQLSLQNVPEVQPQHSELPHIPTHPPSHSLPTNPLKNSELAPTELTEDNDDFFKIVNKCLNSVFEE